MHLYWDIGRAIAQRQQREGWGKAVIPRLACDLHNELPELKGFSERNIDRMVAFYRAYPTLNAISPQLAAKLPEPQQTTLPPAKVPQPVALLSGPTGIVPKNVAESISPQAVAKLTVPQEVLTLNPISPQLAAKLAGTDLPPIVQQLAAQLPWFHHILLMEKIKDLPTRIWYMQQTVANGWSRNILALQIAGRAHLRAGKAVTNFAEHLSPIQSDLATQILKDPYIFDFLTLQEPFQERELETGLLIHVQKFLLELGQGFAFVGRQYHLEVGTDDFYIDLLFYHLQLRCFIVIDLKKGPFQAEYAGKMNFYCNVLDDKLRHGTDQPTIGLILCQDKNRLVAEYALKGMHKAIGVSEYQLTRALPRQLRSSLPTIAQIEKELSTATKTPQPPRPSTRTKSRKVKSRRIRLSR
ncbi:MAG: PDDEXK nuclease domain-containing protein [Phycisphaerae bacterium]